MTYPEAVTYLLDIKSGKLVRCMGIPIFIGFLQIAFCLFFIRLRTDSMQIHTANAIEENMDGGKKGGNRQRMDRKLARKIRQKKIAQGHAEDDREQEMM